MLIDNLFSLLYYWLNNSPFFIDCLNKWKKKKILNNLLEFLYSIAAINYSQDFSPWTRISLMWCLPTIKNKTFLRHNYTNKIWLKSTVLQFLFNNFFLFRKKNFLKPLFTLTNLILIKKNLFTYFNITKAFEKNSFPSHKNI